MSGSRSFMLLLAGALLAGSASAAPQLRLTRTAIGPIGVALGATAAPQSVDAFNAGDGELALDAKSSAPWIQVSLGEARECERKGGVCYPVLIAATTAGLEAGRHTGVVTVLAPGALDAPQTITVTLDAGGSVPKSLAFAVRPGGTDSATIQTSNPVGAVASAQTGGNWLSIPAQASGSFRFSTSHQVEAKHIEGLAAGEYAGRVEISGSPVPDENKVVPATLRVTDGPIAAIGANRLAVRLAAGAGLYSASIEVSNRGGGELAMETPAASAGWIAGAALPGNRGVLVTLNPKELAPGLYRGELEIRSNAANSPNKVEIALEVTPPGEPWMQALSLSDRITVDPVSEIAPAMLLALRGEQLTQGDAEQASGAPWPRQLAGARLLINGVPAAIEAVSATELRFQVPAEVEPGEATLEIERDGTKGNRLGLTLRPAQPRVERFGFEDGTAIGPDKPAKAGDKLLIIATGLGKSDPVVAAGATAPEGAKTVETVAVSFSAGPFAPRIVVEAQAGPSTESPGRYTVKLALPEGIPGSDFVEMRVIAGGASSNRVTLAVR